MPKKLETAAASIAAGAQKLSLQDGLTQTVKKCGVLRLFAGWKTPFGQM